MAETVPRTSDSMLRCASAEVCDEFRVFGPLILS
jgi:hypothetical protein